MKYTPLQALFILPIASWQGANAMTGENVSISIGRKEKKVDNSCVVKYKISELFPAILTKHAGFHEL